MNVNFPASTMADIVADINLEVEESGASQAYPQQCSALRKNGHVIIKVNSKYSFS